MAQHFQPPQSLAFTQTSTRVVGVSISVRLPELPDARMDTRMPIALSPATQDLSKN
jgi:hypothetical protein